ncbi:hypothetical protein LY76DRAFT_582861 [Colletotrichum caudatum]|nr:hypothetical protein LY76DRAFT_582861 [Colletotrichum caudatum]
MAKRKPTFSLQEMEDRLGYSVDPLVHSGAVGCLYSDLRPVPQSIYEKTLREFEENQTARHHLHRGSIGSTESSAYTMVVTRGEDVITITQRTGKGYYTFSVDLNYGFGLQISFLLSQEEGLRLQFRAGNSTNGNLFSLPREVRDRIYALAIPQSEWQIADVDQFDRNIFAGALGDPTGYYYPLSKDLTLLRVSKDIRDEALPLAYRKMIFRLDDLDDLVKLLLAIGNIGRDNIQSVIFPWESRSDLEERWKECRDFDGLSGALPKLHTSKCAQLLRQCKRLRFMRLQFQEDFLATIPPLVFKTDPGIQGLLHLPRIQKVEICDLADMGVEHCLAIWLKTQIEVEQSPTEVSKRQRQQIK